MRLWSLILVAVGVFATLDSVVVANQARRNIVWIVVEDMSPDFGCYGETTIETPNVDRLAAEGVRFTDAIVTAPVCSASRSALVTGMYQTAIGAQHHRSGRGELKIHLPDGVTTIPERFRSSGYHVSNVRFDDFVRAADAVAKNPTVAVAKADYNFETPADLYDTTHWTTRERQQPFFAQIQLHGGKLRGNGDGDKWPAEVMKTLGSRTSPDAVHLPPYLPNDPVIVEDWAQYLDTVRYTDWQVGQIVDRLRTSGDLDNTYIFFITDHGISHVRNKQFCYEGGIHIPLIVRGPTIEPGTVRTDVVEHIDLAASSLALAGIEADDSLQARDILAADYQPRTYGFSARDRCDETIDRIRSVRSQDFKYIRNFYPQRPYLQPNAYKDHKPIVQAMRRLAAEGKLNEAQSRIMAETRPVEELYDLSADPYELNNLADDPSHQQQLVAMRDALDRWMVETDDHGRTPESWEMYDSDMQLYRGAKVTGNIEWMKRAAAEGR